MAKGSRYPHVEYYLAESDFRDSRVLEIGCGAARYRSFFRKSQYIGIDVPNPHYQDWGSVDIFSRAESLPFQNQSFDLIFSQATIDYVEGLHEMLAETYRILKTNGKMLIFTYDRDTLARIHEGAIAPKYVSQRHFHVFDEKQLLANLDIAGYSAQTMPHIFRPHLPLMPWLSSLPIISNMLKYQTSWRSFIARK